MGVIWTDQKIECIITKEHGRIVNIKDQVVYCGNDKVRVTMTIELSKKSKFAGENGLSMHINGLECKKQFIRKKQFNSNIYEDIDTTLDNHFNNNSKNLQILIFCKTDFEKHEEIAQGHIVKYKVLDNNTY